MKDFILFEKHEKTSELKNKFSKSVSYETLVGGTATIGRERGKALEIEGVITRRTLVRRGYLIEQGAQNKESLFSGVNCFMRLPRRILRMLLVMTIPISCREAHKRRFILNPWILRFACTPLRMTFFALIFTLITVGESRAEVINCVNGKYADGTDCEKCGDNCDWSFDSESGKLNVSGSGNMYNYSYSTDSETNAQYTTAPWKAYKGEIKSVKVEGLSTIGSYAFCHSGNQLTAVEMDNTVTDINAGAFAWNGAISTIKLSDSLKNIGYIAFRAGSGGLYPTLIVPDTLEGIGKGSLGTVKNLIQNMQIICLGDELSCARVKNLFNEYKHYGGDYSTETLSLAGNVVVANYEQCSGSYFWNGAGCVREPDVSKRKCCSDVCKDMGGWCNRIRYTPAEAAEVLKDDNTNSVTITFRK